MPAIGSIAKKLLQNKSLLREETLVGQVLSHFHAVEEVRKLEPLIESAEKTRLLTGTPLELMDHPVIALGKRTEGKITYGHELASDTLEHVRIRVSPEFEEPQYRYFRRLLAEDGTKVRMGEGHGLSASAWIETHEHGVARTVENGACDLKLCYPGYTGKPLDGKAHTISMVSSLGREFPQFHEVGPFVEKALDAARAEGIVGRVVNNSWSLGAGNAVASNAYLKARNIPSTAILGDAWGASHAVDYLSKPVNLKTILGSHAEAVRYAPPQRRAMLAQDVISIYPALEKDGAWLRQSLTAPGQAEWHKPAARWAGEKTGAFGKEIGDVVHLNVEDMEVVKKLGFLGNSHHRSNAILQLTRGDHVLVDAPHVSMGHQANRNAGPAMA